MDRYLGVLLGLVSVTAVTIAIPHGIEDTRGSSPMARPPAQLDSWVAVDGAPEDILPTDSRALAAIRRTYVNRDRTIWISLAQYPSRNDPRSRPALHVAERGAISMVHRVVHLDLGATATRVAVNLVSLRYPQRQLAVLYWYQLNDRIIAGEYNFRWRFFVDTVLARRPRVMLVRLAAQSTDDAQMFLRVFSPYLTHLVSGAEGGKIYGAS